MATLLKYKKGLKRPTLAWNEFAIRYSTAVGVLEFLGVGTAVGVLEFAGVGTVAGVLEFVGVGTAAGV